MTTQPAHDPGSKDAALGLDVLVDVTEAVRWANDYILRLAASDPR